MLDTRDRVAASRPASASAAAAAPAARPAGVECQPNGTAPLLRDERSRRDWVEHEISVCCQARTPLVGHWISAWTSRGRELRLSVCILTGPGRGLRLSVCIWTGPGREHNAICVGCKGCAGGRALQSRMRHTSVCSAANRRWEGQAAKCAAAGSAAERLLHASPCVSATPQGFRV
jgi:hypothetical protein